MLKWQLKQSMLHSLKKLVYLQERQRRLLIEAGIAIGFAVFQLRRAPFKQIVADWGNSQAVSLDSHTDTLSPQAKEIGWAINAINRRLPWQGTCLVQAMAARRMLRRQSISNTIYFGVRSNSKSDKSTTLDAHAWLSVGDCILVGKSGHKQFSVLSIFVDSYET